jgi:hypothetical protein
MINKQIFAVLAGICLLPLFNAKAQELTQKQQEYEENKVEIFSVKERDNVQLWSQEEVSKMGLSEEERSKYSNTILHYLSKMRRLDDKDMGYSKEEMIKEMDELVVKQNAELKEWLTEEQYKMHLEIYDEMILMIKNRIGETEY